MRKLLATLIGTAFAAAMVAAAGAAPQDKAKDDAAKKIEAGQKAYDTQKCSTCHAIKGVGGKLSVALDGVGGKRTADEVKKWLTTPAEMEAKLPKKPVMPMSTYLKTHKLTEADVEGLVAYMMSLK